MRNRTWQRTAEYVKNYQHRKKWQKIVTGMAAVVVFCTIYALILPAITMEKEEAEQTSSKADIQKSNSWGDIGNCLDGDYAYISEVAIKKIVDGAIPFDDDDEPGNDSNANNQRVRSFDMLSYTVDIKNKVRSDSPYTYYKEGTLYFEFVLPASEKQAMFDADSMAWLRAKPEIKYQITSGKYKGQDAQFLRGSFLWQPSGDVNHAIGESIIGLDVYLRVLAMKEGDTLSPEFTFWLEGNDIPSEEIVTGSEISCQMHGEIEYRTAVAEPVTVSSEPRYNVRIVEGKYHLLDDFDFKTGNEYALNKDAGVVYGRRVNYGIVLQIRGKDKAHGLRGCEIPEDKSRITFDLDISSKYTYSDTEGTIHTIDSGENGYTPLVWSVDLNGEYTQRAQYDGRAMGRNRSEAQSVPAGTRWRGGIYQNYQSCRWGGNWIGKLTDNKQKLTCEISGHELYGTGNKLKLEDFPYGNVEASSNEYIYYNPQAVSGYWEIDQACFSAGELWIVQPFKNKDGINIAETFGTGSFELTVRDVNLEIRSSDNSKVLLPGAIDNSNQMVTTDDQAVRNIALELPGEIDYDIAFQKIDSLNWNDALTDGCWDNGQDWITAGDELAIFDYIQHKAEGEKMGVAYDQLVKFDPDYFTPYEHESGTIGYWKDGLHIKVGYGAVAKAPKSGWDHNGKEPNEAGYDEAMINATADDLIFFSSLSELQEKGYRCVGVLFEFRGCCDTDSFHSDQTVKGYATTDQTLSGNVFMITHSASVWIATDVREEAAKYLKKPPNELTSDDYSEYARNGFPSRLGENAGKNMKYEDTYPAYPNNYNNQGVNGTNKDRSALFQNYEKARYGEAGYSGGSSGTDYGDSCLLVGYTMEIDKSVTQTTMQGQEEQKKTTYSMDDGQRYVDFQLIGASKVGKKNSDNGSGETNHGTQTTVYIEDILPKGLSYVDGSAYYGGVYHQAAEGRQGNVIGGKAITPEITKNKDGTTTLRYTLDNVMLSMDKKTTLPPIYYTCKIGNTINLSEDVKNGEKLVNEAKIWSEENQVRKFTIKNRNLATYEIHVSKLIQANISKVADQLYVDVGSDIGFTMAIGNNGAQSRKIVALDVLPYDSGGGTQFANGEDCLSQVTELTLKNNTQGAYLAKMTVYYSEATDEWVRGTDGVTYREKTEEEILALGWKKLEMSISDGIGTVSLPADFKPTGILVIGELGAAQTLGIHLTMRLTNDVPGDCVVNHLYESGESEVVSRLHAQATAYVAGRTLEGLTWLDTSAEGIQDTGEARISGVKVTLMKLKEEGNASNENDYEPYHYQNDPSKPEIIIETGQQISVQSASAAGTAEYETGRYKFTNLPAGIFGVKFTDGTGITKISRLIASPANMGKDDTVDSDGRPTYTADKRRLEQTMILNIEMPEVKEMRSALYESKYHDSGFYERGVELPATGGIGVTEYIMGGLLAMTGAGLLLLYSNKKCGKEDFASS